MESNRSPELIQRSPVGPDLDKLFTSHMTIKSMMTIEEKKIEMTWKKNEKLVLGAANSTTHSSTSTPPNDIIVTSSGSQEASVQATSWMISYVPLEQSKYYIFPKVTNI
jgi:hypothetical protein